MTKAITVYNYSAAINIIKSFEGIMDGDPDTVNLDPYLCPANYWTIGWGHLVRDKNNQPLKFGVNKMKAYAVYPYGITMEQAEELLFEDVQFAVGAVERKVQVPLNSNQFSALVSFVFNLGIGNFSNSTLLRLLNNGDYDSVPCQLSRWTKANGRELNGLIRRRKAEADLWNTTI